MSRDRIAKGLAFLLLVTVLIGDGMAVHYTHTLRLGNRFDLYPRWVGVRAMLFEGLNPYSPEVTARAQIGYYGRLAQEGESPHDFLYPAFVAFTIPHFLLPFPAAITTWIVTQQVFLILVVVMMTTGLQGHRADIPTIPSTAKRRPRPWQIAIVSLAVIAFRYNVMALWTGQFTIYVLFFVVLAWWLWQRGHNRTDFWAGCALTQALLKPQLTFLILPLWLGLALVQRRWRFIAGFASCLALLIILPMPFAGNWLPHFLDPPARYEQAIVAIPIPEQTVRALRIGLSAVLWPLAAWVWAKAAGLRAQGRTIRCDRPPAFPTVGYALALTTAIILITTPRIWSYDLAMATLPLVFLVLARYRRGVAATVVKASAWAFLLALPWILTGLIPLNQVEITDRLIVGPLLLGLLLLFLVVRSRLPEREFERQDTQ
jgi:hypothetical protein